MALQVTYRYKVQKPDPEQRKQEGSVTLKMYPTMVPVIVGRVHKSGLPELENHKLLLPATSQVGDVVKYMNEKLRRPSHAPLYLYVDNEIVASENSSLARLYQEFRDNDYFLYIAYHEELIRSTDKNAK